MVITNRILDIEINFQTILCPKWQFINGILYYHSSLGAQILLFLEMLKFSNFTFFSKELFCEHIALEKSL
jgi:hypothetical protein